MVLDTWYLVHGTGYWVLGTKYLCMVNNSVGGESVETVLTVTGLDSILDV